MCVWKSGKLTKTAPNPPQRPADKWQKQCPKKQPSVCHLSAGPGPPFGLHLGTVWLHLGIFWFHLSEVAVPEARHAMPGAASRHARGPVPPCPAGFGLPLGSRKRSKIEHVLNTFLGASSRGLDSICHPVVICTVEAKCVSG